MAKAIAHHIDTTHKAPYIRIPKYGKFTMLLLEMLFHEHGTKANTFSIAEHYGADETSFFDITIKDYSYNQLSGLADKINYFA